MADEIIIISGNTTNHTLELSDGGHTRTTKGKKIKWEIKDGANVRSIENIQRKSGDDIFSELPTREDSKKWKAKIKDWPPKCGIYVYSISWTDNEGKPHTYDPIISINPSTSFFKITEAVLLVATAALALLTFQFLQKNKK